MDSEKKSGSNKWLIILLAVSLAGNVYQVFNKKSTVSEYETQVDSLVTARVDVESELRDTYAELDKYKGINEKLDSLLTEANSKVDEQKARIEKLMRSERNSVSLNKKLKEEVAELQKLRDEYLSKIDSLLVENLRLREEKTKLDSSLAMVSKSLETTVATASVLRSEYVKVNAYKKKGSGKYSSTAMAKRTNKMEICFTVLANPIAQRGEKTAYLRIIEPGGKTMGGRAEGSKSMRTPGGEEILITSSRSFSYANENQNLCLHWEESEHVFPPGTYTIEVFVDGMVSASSQFTLR